MKYSNLDESFKTYLTAFPEKIDPRFKTIAGVLRALGQPTDNYYIYLDNGEYYTDTSPSLKVKASDDNCHITAENGVTYLVTLFKEPYVMKS